MSRYTEKIYNFLYGFHLCLFIDFDECANPGDNTCDSQTTMCMDTACDYNCICLSGCEMIPGNSNMCQGIIQSELTLQYNV